MTEQPKIPLDPKLVERILLIQVRLIEGLYEVIDDIYEQQREVAKDD